MRLEAFFEKKVIYGRKMGIQGGMYSSEKLFWVNLLKDKIPCNRQVAITIVVILYYPEITNLRYFL